MEQLKEMVKTGNAPETVKRVQILLDEGKSPEAIMGEALIPAMDLVGDLFQQGEYFLPEMMVAARAMKQGAEVLKPLMTASEIEPIGKVVIGTVKGDLHDIGKNLVIMSLEGAGFKVIDLGIDVEADTFVQAAKEHSPQVLGISALLSTTMVEMKGTVEAVRASGLDVKIMIGGAPVSQQFCDEIGADFYGYDSVSGRDYARRVITQSK